MRKLTQREKVLVYIAVVLLLLTGVYYLVKIPSDMKRVRTEAELKIIQLQERESENDLTGKSVLEQEIGREQGVIGENEVLISTGTRNFKGRAGHPSSKVYLGSAATVTASAIAGEIALAEDVM